MPNFLSKFLDSMSYDDDFEEDEFEPDEEFDDLDYSEPEVKEPKRSFRSFIPSRKSTKEEDDDDVLDAAEENEDRSATRRSFMSSRKSTVVPIKKSTMEVCMFKPTIMDDSREICNILCSGRTVVLNLEGLNYGLQQRIMDFSCGAVYAIDGKLQQISKSIFILTPKSVELSGDFLGSKGIGSDDISFGI